MPDVLLFQPQAHLSAQDNLEEFIRFCRVELTTYGGDLEFDEDCWDISASVTLRGHGDKAHRLYFTNYDPRRRGSKSLVSPFREFAKAYLRYTQGLRPVEDPSRRLAAMRVLESALLEANQIPCVTALTPQLLNRAAALAGATYGGQFAYQTGQCLEGAAALVSDLKLSQSPLSRWRNHLRRKQDIRTRIGPDFEARRAECLPTDEELEALGRAYRAAQDPLDVLITSIAALMCCAPDRANEILALGVDCEVERERADGTRELGLRWPGSKGAPAGIKWIVPTMEHLARDALARVKRVTEGARQVASWYEREPDKLYLPPHLSFLRDRDCLDADEFADLAAVSRKHKGDWYKPRGLKPSSCYPWKISFASVERAIIATLPRSFPWADKRTGLRFSEALCVIPAKLTRPGRIRSSCAVEQLTINQLNQQLGSAIQHGKSSVFSRLGITLLDGSNVSLRTNQFRHMLNTIAQGAGLTQFEIAKWSGREDVQQNAAYDHVAAETLLEQVDDILGHGKGGRDVVAPRPPVPMKMFNELGIKTAHTTETGFCVHDFVMSPCQLQLECDNCDEHLCVKGDLERNARVRDRLAINLDLLNKAERAAGEGRPGADPWLKHQRTTVKRLQALVDVLNDPEVPIGAVIRLSRTTGASLIDAAATDRRFLMGGASETPEMRAALIDQAEQIRIESLTW